jgi:hypothetical protein
MLTPVVSSVAPVSKMILKVLALKDEAALSRVTAQATAAMRPKQSG